MIELTDAQIGAWVGRHLWPLFRIASFMMIVPVIGTQLVPARVRLMLALGLTVVIAPILPPTPEIDPLSLAAVPIIIHQASVGIALGFAALMLFQLFVVAGQMIAMQMGLGFASMVDPTNGVTVTVLSQFYLMLATLIYLAMNGHLVMLEVIVESFRQVPISTTGLLADSWWHLATHISWMFAGALVVALPAVTALLIVNITFGVMTRAAPQMNVFSIGFPLSVVFGLLLFWVSTAGLLPQFDGFAEETFQFLRVLAQPS